MSTSAAGKHPPPASAADSHEGGQEPLARPEFSLRAVIVGILMAIFIGAAYPYVVLKIGFGPNMSVVSAFLGFIVLSLIGKVLAPRSNRFEYNIVQTAGTAAGQQGFMVIVLAAFDLIASNESLGTRIELSTLQIFLWLTLAGSLGVLLAVPLRKHYIDEEKLTFADGTAAGETLMILDQDYKTARKGVWALSIGGVTAFFHTLFSQAPKWRIFPEVLDFGKWGERLHVGTSWSLLAYASGMLVGMRVTLSMGLGMFLSWYLAPPILQANGFIPEQAFRPNLAWIMWPALGLMVSGGLTALALKWKVILRTFKDIKMTSIDSSDFPIRWVIIGSIVLTIALVVMQKISLGLAPWLSLAAILISVPLMLVGTRVLGETNWAPISTMANLVQVLFAGLAPGNVGVNMISSGMSGTVAANGEHLMQDYKAGKIIGSNNRYLTYMQLLALPFGALSVAVIYPLLKAQNGIGPERYGLAPEMVGKVAGQGLVAPASIRWAGFAEVLSKGLGTLQESRPYALHALGIALLVGIVLTVLEPKSRWVPSVTSMGLGMLIEARFVLPMMIGGILQYVWSRLNARQESELNIPLSSGIIVGEALAVLGIVGLTLVGVFSDANPGESVIPTYVWGGFFGVLIVALLGYARRMRGPGDEVPITRSAGGH